MPVNNRSLIFLEKLKSALEMDERLQKLLQLDAALEKEAGIAEISKKMKVAAEDYGEARQHYGISSLIAKEKGKELAQIKTLLDSQPLVESYTELYREVSGIYLTINDILFGDLNASPFGAKHD